jgi:hypothetical protein
VVARWCRESGGDGDVLRFLGDATDPEIALAVGHLLWPCFVEARGCVLRQDAYSLQNLERWWNELDGDVACIESVVNHLHLWDVFPNYDASAAGVVSELADLLVHTWSAALATEFSDRGIVVERDDHYGPGITFHRH